MEDNQTPKQPNKNTWTSRLLLLLGFLVIGISFLYTLLALAFGALIWSSLAFGNVLGVILIIWSHRVGKQSIAEPNKPIKLVALAGLITGYFLIITAGMITTAELFLSDRLRDSIYPLPFVIIGVVLVVWSSKVRSK